MDPPHESPSTASQAVGEAMQTRVEVMDPSNPLDPSYKSAQKLDIKKSLNLVAAGNGHGHYSAPDINLGKSSEGLRSKDPVYKVKSSRHSEKDKTKYY